MGVDTNHQLFFTQPGVAALEERPIPTPGPTQLLIRTRTSLISPGTERAFFLGLPNTTQNYPMPTGYCNIGEVVAAGDQVDGWQMGERVASLGHHAGYVLVDAVAAHRVPAGLSDEDAPFFRLASIALQGIRKARIELGESVAVIGAGLIGLMALQLARLQGALPVISIDQDEGRLDFASQGGADIMIAATEGVAAEVAKQNGGDGATVVIEATGNPDAIVTAFHCAKRFGRVVLLGSTRGETDHVNFYRDVHRKGLTILGAHDSARPRHESSPGMWTQVADQQVALELLARKRLLVRPYITNRFAWSDAPAAYEILRSWNKNALAILLLDLTRMSSGEKSSENQLRGKRFFSEPGVAGFTHRAFTKAMGYDEADIARPLIGICNTYSEINNCNSNLRELADAVKRGVLMAGGFPLEFPTISLGEIFLSPTSMLHRNLAAIDTEEMIRAQPLDGVVLLVNCDKTTPAALMGACSADIPTIALSGGPALNGWFRGQMLGACTDCRRMTVEHQAGTLTDETYRLAEDNVFRSKGHCMVMGTASTMNSILEALGIALPGTGATPAVDARRIRLAEHTGRAIVDVVRRDLRPSQLLTRAAFENAITLLCALGGSTNAVVHLPAIAGRLGIELPLELFDEISRRTPVIANIRPSGTYQMEDLFYAGGIPAVLRQLLPLLHGDLATVSGRTLAENVRDVELQNSDVIRTLDNPLQAEGGLAILRGNLAPDGAVIKHSAATPALLNHRGAALVFRDFDDLLARINDPDLPATPDSVLVLQNSGPLGGPGMPEIGNLPIPHKLLQQGVRDMVRISDARMSGTAYGTIVLHVAPESAIGGPLALVQDGDEIELDLKQRRLQLYVDQDELDRRRARWQPPPLAYRRGYGQLYLRHVTQAPQGADFDFLQGSDPVKIGLQPKF